MSLKYQLENLDGLDEGVKPFYKERDGAFVLDVEDLPQSKTDKDVEALDTSLHRERDSHKITKGKLQLYRELGEPDDIRNMLDELETIKASGGRVNESLLEEKRLRRAAEKERDSFKSQWESHKQRLEELEKLDTQRKIELKFREMVKELGPGYNESKIFATLEDYLDFGYFKLDELGELVTVRGKPAAEWLKNKVENPEGGFKVQSSPGGSNPRNNQNQKQQKDFFEEIASALH